MKDYNNDLTLNFDEFIPEQEAEKQGIDLYILWGTNRYPWDVDYDEDFDSLVFRFTTAWSPSEALVGKLAVSILMCRLSIGMRNQEWILAGL